MRQNLICLPIKFKDISLAYRAILQHAAQSNTLCGITEGATIVSNGNPYAISAYLNEHIGYLTHVHDVQTPELWLQYNSKVQDLYKKGMFCELRMGDFVDAKIDGKWFLCEIDSPWLNDDGMVELTDPEGRSAIVAVKDLATPESYSLES